MSSKPEKPRPLALVEFARAGVYSWRWLMPDMTYRPTSLVSYSRTPIEEVQARFPGVELRPMQRLGGAFI